MTAKEAARQLGVSRKTYYLWESRGLEGMVQSLSSRPAGRPEKPVDGEKESLRARVAALEKELSLARQSLAIREILIEEAIATAGKRSPAEKKE
jgi:transposase